MLLSSNVLPIARRTPVPPKFTLKFVFVHTTIDGQRVIVERQDHRTPVRVVEDIGKPLNTLGEYPAAMGFRREHYVRLPRFFQKRIFAIREAQMSSIESEKALLMETDDASMIGEEGVEGSVGDGEGVGEGVGKRVVGDVNVGGDGDGNAGKEV